jgi:Na+/glutamate symporter
MAKRSNPMKLIMILGGIALVGILAYSSFQQTQKHYEVCVTFKSASHCATAAGATPTEAIRSAQEIDCQLLTNGRDENMVCLDSVASSVREIK